MNNTRIEASRPNWRLLALCAALVSAQAMAAGKPGPDEALARYEQERAACYSGPADQYRSACLREAGAALAQARRGSLDDGTAPYQRNASKRCDALPEPERTECQARMQGQGSTSGSVAGGGISRELVTREAGAPTVAKPAASGITRAP